MVNEIDESLRKEKSESMIQLRDLLYPFAFILLMLSFFDLTGTIAIFALVAALIAEIFVITSEADITIINLAVNLIAQISSIAIFLVLHKMERVEPEEKDMPLGNHWVTTYLVYSLVILFTLVTVFIDSYLESLGFPEKSPYEAIEPTVDLMDNPLFYILFFGTLVIGAAIWEELVFRRAFIPFLERRGFGTFWVLLVSSILFSLMHTPTDLLSGSVRFAITHFFTTFAGGFALGFLYMRTRKIIWPIIMHGLVNGVAGVGMIGVVREEEFGDVTIEILAAIWIFVALIVGAGTVIYLVFQMIRYRNLKDRPAWYRILSDFNIRSTRLTPIAMIALGFIVVEGGVPLVLDFFFGLFGEPSQELALIQYLIEIVYLGILVLGLIILITRRVDPLQKPDWVSDTSFPDSNLGYVTEYLTPPTSSQHQCRFCGRELIPNTQFCVYCGTKVGISCPSCGREILPNTQYCVYCGKKF